MSKNDKAKDKGRKRKAKAKGRGRSLAVKLLKWVAVTGIWGLFIGLCFVAWLAYDLPDLSRLTSATRRPSITLVTTDGQILASYGDLYGKQVNLDDLPPYLPDALLATEDRRFYSHFGVDPRGLLRAIYTNFRAGHLVQGGSTITQQLAKNVFLTPDRTIRRKGQELLLALWFEHSFTKQQILTLYLNRVYFGAGTYGVDAAAQKYFGKPAAKVSPFEAAMLAGMVKAPSRYNPLSDPKRATDRAKLVLANMVDAGYMTDRDATRAIAQGIANLKTPAAASGQYYADWVLDQVSSYVNYIDRDLVVVTTIDGLAQQAAETTVAKIMGDADAAKNANQAALVAMSPDGAVRAMVGGRDYAASQFNRATQALRPPGSSFKLFVYLAAMESGMAPDDRLVDGPISVGNWRPANYDDHYYGDVSLRDAFAHSLNSVAVQISEKVGHGKVIDAARRLGVTADLTDQPSIALGASGVSLLEMTGAYAAFDNRGFGVWPYGISQILDAQGNVLYKRSGSGPSQVVGAHAAGQMLDMMQAVVTSGTGRAAQLDRPVAGKTGTSQDYRDAWFIGFTADLVTGVWVGNDDNTPMNKVTGGSLPTRIWHDFMTATLVGTPPQPLPAPSGELPVVALTPVLPTPPVTDTTGTTAATDAQAAPVQPLGDNTPSPEIQSVIERLKLLSRGRQK
jgi:penicillin-binding protein 1A